jgi:hypothetical protein
MPTPLLSNDGLSGGLPHEAMFSFSPAEVLLPPIHIAIARLAAESAVASCWVQQLWPQGGDCQEPAGHAALQAPTPKR